MHFILIKLDFFSSVQLTFDVIYRKDQAYILDAYKFKLLLSLEDLYINFLAEILLFHPNFCVFLDQVLDFFVRHIYTQSLFYFIQDITLFYIQMMGKSLPTFFQCCISSFLILIISFLLQ